MVTDLVVVGDMEYNVALGMNWLSTFHASVNCFEKRITLKLMGSHNFNLKG